MDFLLQQILNGIVIGCLYAVVALGYTMVYGILGLINFAHGDVLMVGALTTYAVVDLAGQWWPQLPGLAKLGIGLAVSIPACMALGYTIERTAYRRLRNAPKLAPLITAIGISFLLQTLAMILWGRDFHTFPQLIPAATLQVAPNVVLSSVQLVIIVLSFLMMGGLLLLVQKTRLGRAMRATAENHKAASLMGIDTDRVIASTFVIGSSMAAIAGVLFASNYSIAHYSMGFMPGLKAFTAAVLGGVGNLPGAMLGGLVLGLVESLGAGYIQPLSFGFLNSSYQDIFAFAILGLVLIFRPTGLLGERVRDRA